LSKRLTRKIDPTTGSYVREDGAWVEDDTGFTQLYLATMTEHGTVPSDRDLGNKGWLIEKLSGRTPDEFKEHMEASAQHVIDDGIVDTFEVVYCHLDPKNPNALLFGWKWTAGSSEPHYWDSSIAWGSD